MKDRYLFKAKRLDNGEWVQGALIYDDRDKLYRIITEINYSTGTCLTADNAPRVDLSTICQCTGLKDKNGKLIYEGDIVKCLYNSYGENGVYIGKVIYREDTCCFVDANSESTDYEWWEEEKEVIGNIFDNKELLESEE